MVVTAELYEQVKARMDVENNPPDGMILHTAGASGGTWVNFDVWGVAGDLRAVPERAPDARHPGDRTSGGDGAHSAAAAGDLRAPRPDLVLIGSTTEPRPKEESPSAAQKEGGANGRA
jgi:hypothetical protein